MVGRLPTFTADPVNIQPLGRFGDSAILPTVLDDRVGAILQGRRRRQGGPSSCPA